MKAAIQRTTTAQIGCCRTTAQHSALHFHYLGAIAGALSLLALASFAFADDALYVFEPQYDAECEAETWPDNDPDRAWIDCDTGLAHIYAVGPPGGHEGARIKLQLARFEVTGPSCWGMFGEKMDIQYGYTVEHTGYLTHGIDVYEYDGDGNPVEHYFVTPLQLDGIGTDQEPWSLDGFWPGSEIFWQNGHYYDIVIWASCEAHSGSNEGSGSGIECDLDLGAIYCLFWEDMYDVEITKPKRGKVYINGQAWPPGGFSLRLPFATVFGSSIPAHAQDNNEMIHSVQFKWRDTACETEGSGSGEFSCALEPSDGSWRPLPLKCYAYNDAGEQVAAADPVPVRFLKTGGSNDDGGGACWLAGTRITMADGTEKNIEDVVIGDEVLAYDILQDDTMPSTVMNVTHHGEEDSEGYHYVINDSIRVTSNHFLYANGVLTPAEELLIGDMLRSADGGEVPIESIDVVYDPVETYNIEIATEERTCDAYQAYLAEEIVAYPRKGNRLESMIASLLYEYEITDIVFSQDASDCHAYASNDAGIIVGEAGGHAFMWQYGVGVTDLGAGAAYDINNADPPQVAGGFWNGYFWEAVVWEGGEMTPLGWDGVARVINDSGVVGGDTQSGGLMMFDPAYGEDPMELPGRGREGNHIWGINSEGVLVGEQGGLAKSWEYFAGFWIQRSYGSGIAYDINDAGLIVGESNGSAVTWEYAQPEEMTELGPGVAYSLNESGQIVGETDGHAFLWDSQNGMTRLSDLTWEWSGWEPTAARDINESGEIIGWDSTDRGTRSFQAVSTECSDSGGNGIPDECDADCNGNGLPDDYDIVNGLSEDCNENGVPDECDIADGDSHDCNGNGVPDECDIADGTSQDCQPNGIPDECDIANGTSQDNDGNGVPDECECPADFDGDGDVDTADLLFLLGAWSTPDGDVDGDGDTDTADLLALLGAWGECP
ncbi:MAG: polymorphic toxin-type HINT domain-containing protein [Planctomycetota bacterium]|nr:polymorphic toxin-type HINT domain-containing protein [Planctomycetota bacterium]